MIVCQCVVYSLFLSKSVNTSPLYVSVAKKQHNFTFNLKVTLNSVSLFFKAEAFGGEIAQQGDGIQEETSRNC